MTKTERKIVDDFLTKFSDYDLFEKFEDNLDFLVMLFGEINRKQIKAILNKEKLRRKVNDIKRTDQSS